MRVEGVGAQWGAAGGRWLLVSAIGTAIRVELLEVHVPVSNAEETDFEVDVNTGPLADQRCHGCNDLSDN